MGRGDRTPETEHGGMWEIDHGSRVLAADPGQHHVARMTLNQCGDLAVVAAKDRVAFSVTGHR